MDPTEPDKIWVKDAPSLEEASQYLLMEPLPGEPTQIKLILSLSALDRDNTQPAIERFTKALLETKETISKTTIILSCIMDGVSEENILKVCSAAGKAKSLRQLVFRNSPHRRDCWRYLEATLSFAKSLTVLYFDEVDFDWETKSFAAFAAALQGHPSLKEVHFRDCTLRQTKMIKANIAPVFEALRSIPNLSSLSLGCLANFFFAKQPDLIEGSLRDVCGHPNLRTLEFENKFWICSSNIITAALMGIQDGKNVRHLTIRPRLKAEEIHMLAQVIRRTPLETLNISLLVPGGKSPNADANVLRILSALQGSKANIHLLLQSGYGERRYIPSKEVQAAIVSVLIEAPNFESLSFHPELRNDMVEPGFLRWVECLLRLKPLLKDSRFIRRQWVDVLIRASADVDILFYILSTNPNLCALQNKKRVRLSESVVCPVKKKKRLL